MRFPIRIWFAETDAPNCFRYTFIQNFVHTVWCVCEYCLPAIIQTKRRQKTRETRNNIIQTTKWPNELINYEFVKFTGCSTLTTSCMRAFVNSIVRSLEDALQMTVVRRMHFSLACKLNSDFCRDWFIYTILIKWLESDPKPTSFFVKLIDLVYFHYAHKYQQ